MSFEYQWSKCNPCNRFTIRIHSPPLLHTTPFQPWKVFRKTHKSQLMTRSTRTSHNRTFSVIPGENPFLFLLKQPFERKQNVYSALYSSDDHTHPIRALSFVPPLTHCTWYTLVFVPVTHLTVALITVLLHYVQTHFHEILLWLLTFYFLSTGSWKWGRKKVEMLLDQDEGKKITNFTNWQKCYLFQRQLPLN